METWANDLVGRWWEVFWDPESSSSEKTENNGKVASKIVDLTCDEEEGGAAGGRGRNVLPTSLAVVGGVSPAAFQQYLQLQYPQDTRMALPKQLSQPGGTNTTTQNNTIQLQEINIVFTAATLGLSLVLVRNTKITVKEIKSQEQNVVEMLRINDVLVGVNGKKFDELLGIRIEGREAFQAVINCLKVQRRPMSIMFERWVTATSNAAEKRVGGDANNNGATATSTAAGLVVGGGAKSNGKDLDDIPLNKLHHHNVRKRMNDGDGSINQDVATTAAATAENDNADDDDDDTEADDVDWYDAKVLCYNAKNKKFTVYFLGSETTVSYEMSLWPKVVRPSVRAWTRRTLALLSLDRKVSVLGGSEFDYGRGAYESMDDWLPPTTERREDTQQLEIISQSERNRYESVCTINAVQQMLEYKILLAKQQHLAAHLSPHVDEDEEEDEEDEGGLDGPGPLADPNYITHLCNCMKEAGKTCDWLIGESAVLDVACKLIVTDESSCSAVATTTTTSTTTRGDVLSFLANGARILKHMLSFDPSNKCGGALLSTSAQRGQRKRGRKKRRVESTLNDTGGAEGSAIRDEVFHTMPSNALQSNESLTTNLNQLLNKSAVSNQLWISSTLARTVSRLFRELWEPITIWISKSEDMINGTSGQLYSFEDVECHVQLAQTKGTNLVLIDLSEWTAGLLAKLSRAHVFEMEVWSAIRACTQPVVMVLSMAGPTVGDDECLLALQRLKDEATCATPQISPQYVANDPIMRNLNPLGRCTLDSATGLTLPSCLNRGVINDAISVRIWILDFYQAKTVRERTGFLQVNCSVLSFNSLPGVLH